MANILINEDKEVVASILKGSLYEFTKYFLKEMTRREYIESRPIGRESHQITICKALTTIHRLGYSNKNLLINIQPGAGKTLHLCMFVAWCMAQHPDCNFIYLSYSHTLAAKQTAFIKRIMSSQMYRYLFDVELARDSRAKDHFKTTKEGTVSAFGTGGAVTGQDAGLPGLDRFSGAVIIDDAHKPDESHSDTIRQAVIRNYKETIRQRPRSNNVPIIYIGQRVHEDDLAAFFLNKNDIREWEAIILESLDKAGNALCPDITSAEELKELIKKSPYVAAAQYQQNPVPAGGGLFKKEWFVQLDTYPKMLKTFITVDTAETSKSYNDATVFSFWGIYEIESMGRKIDLMGLHWIDCVEIRVEPKDLQPAFLDFLHECYRFETVPTYCAIEKKSTGSSLLSSLEDIRGIQVVDVDRSRPSATVVTRFLSKTDRFLRIQPYLANKQVSINKGANHVDLCLEHMAKITANNTHRFDDIADTLADAVGLALIEKHIMVDHATMDTDDKLAYFRKDMLHRAQTTMR